MKKTFFLIILLYISSLSAQNSFPSINVKDYGATGHKESLATESLQKAIDAAVDQGGGTVYFPAGDYLSGSLILGDNLTLWLEAGATLWASQNPEDYPFETQARRPTLLFADSARNLSIRGRGTIHGQARRTYEALKKVDYFIADITENARQAGVEMKMYYKVAPYVRLITFENCQDILLEDIQVIESPSWAITMKWCNEVTIRGLTVRSDLDAGVNSDGIDIDGTSNVTISDCIITTGDDAIVLKSSHGKTLHYQDVHNVTVNNCILTSTSTGLKIGTETVGDFRDIVFTNCVIRNTNRGLSIVVRYGGTVENVLFSNLTVETTRKHFNWWGNGEAIWIVLKERNQRYGMGAIRNIRFENIIAYSQGTSKIEGYAPDSLHPQGSRLENITLSNVEFHQFAEDYRDKRATNALEIHDVSGLTLKDVSVDWEEKRTEAKWQSALQITRVDQLRLLHFTGRQGLVASRFPVIQLMDIDQGLVQDVLPTQGANTLIEVGGSATRQLYLQNLDPLQQIKDDYSVQKSVQEQAVTIE